MSPKSHICRWLHEEIVPRAGSWLASSKAGGDQNGLHLGSVTGSSDAENQLTSRTVPGYFRMAMVAAEGDEYDAGVDRRAPADGGVDAPAEPAEDDVKALREASEAAEGVSKVTTDPST